MKNIFLAVFLTTLCSSVSFTNEKDRLFLIIMNDPKQRPIATDTGFFWRNKQYLDTISINSKRYVKFFEKNLKNLQKESFGFYTSDKNWEGCNFVPMACFIYMHGKFVDTIYTTQFFDLWEINKKCYYDSTKHFQEMFAGLFLFRHER